MDHYEEKGGPTENLDCFDLKASNQGLDKEVNERIDAAKAAASEGLQWVDGDPVYNRTRTAIECYLLEDAADQMISYLDEPAQKEIKRLEKDIKSGGQVDWQRERVKQWRGLTGYFNWLCYEAKIMADDMKVQVVRLPLT